MIQHLSSDLSRNTNDFGGAQVGGDATGVEMNSENHAMPHDGTDGGFLGGAGGNVSGLLQQQMPPNQVDLQGNGGGGGLNISNEIKRLQQLHQIGSGSNSNALLMNPGSGQHDASTAAFLQMLDSQQRGNPNRFENPLASSMAMSAAPFGGIPGALGGTSVGSSGMSNNGVINQMQLPSNFFADARLLMAQNHLQQQAAAVMSFPGMQPPIQGGGNPEMPLPSPHSLFHRDGSRRMRGGVIEPFPEKLHRLLSEVEAAGRSDVIAFVATGRAFAIHKPDKFFKEIVPLYFRQSRLSSFKRQLNLYGFELINTGPARGGYYHELFVKDRPELCRRMRRVAIKVVSNSDTTKDDAIEHDEAAKTESFDLDKAATHSGIPGLDLE